MIVFKEVAQYKRCSNGCSGRNYYKRTTKNMSGSVYCKMAKLTSHILGKDYCVGYRKVTDVKV